jgi:hypothetical protein
MQTCKHENLIYQYNNDATCTEDGTEDEICNECGYTETKIKVGSALGHIYPSEWTISKEATCEEDGIKIKVCTRCGNDQITDTIFKLGHSYPDDWTIVTPASCEVEGLKKKKCIRCDNEITEVIPALEHTWSDNGDGTHTCITEGGCGTTEECSPSDPGTTCEKCGHEFEAEVFGFSIDQTQSDPNSMISYIEGTVNENYTPVHMDYDNDIFDYGDWENAFFIKNLRPCVLNFNGTEEYLLDHNNYKKKLDGTAIDSLNGVGNVMVGIPRVYFKITPIDDDHCNFYFSDKKVDDNYHCWAHINNYGDEVPYCYLSAYDGVESSNILRSMSGMEPTTKKTSISKFAEYAYANNQNDDNIWSITCYNDWLLITLLLWLISKTTDHRTAFGQGNTDSYVNVNKQGYINSGTMDQKGLFWGSTDKVSGVKIFGIENFWGNAFRFIYGLIDCSNVLKVKLTYGTQDGSTVEGYNFTGDGYIEVGQTQSTGGLIKSLRFTENGIFIKDVDESGEEIDNSMYYTTTSWKSSNGTYSAVASFGGDTIHIKSAGPLFMYFCFTADGSDNSENACIKCLPKVS